MIATTFDGIVDMPSGCDVLAVSVTVSQRIVVITGGLRGAISAGLRVGLAAFRTLTRINLRAWWTRLLWYHLWALLPSCCDVVTIGLTVSLRIVAITGGLRGAASAGLRVCCVNPRIARKIKRSISCVKLGAVKLDKRKNLLLRRVLLRKRSVAMMQVVILVEATLSLVVHARAKERR
jgi:hypothetical protein